MPDIKTKPNPEASALIAEFNAQAMVMISWDADVGEGVIIPQVNFFKLCSDGGIDLVDKKDATIMPYTKAVILARQSQEESKQTDWWRGKNPLYEVIKVK